MKCSEFPTHRKIDFSLMSITDNCTTLLLLLECFNVEQLKKNKVISAIACFIIVFMVQYDFKRCCMIFGAKLDINFYSCNCI